MTRRLARVAALALVCAVMATPAFARHHHKNTHYNHISRINVSRVIIVCDHRGCSGLSAAIVSRRATRIHTSVSVTPSDERIVSHPSDCSWHAFCGCGVSVWAFGHSIRDLWLAANWYRFPRDRAASGNVAIFGRHHVAGIITAYGDGTALLYDPNSGGHLTRIHRRNIAGATIVNPHASRSASR